MAKRNRKRKNDASDWLASVQKNPPVFEYWKKLSRQYPIQPKRKRPMSAYADRSLGIFMVGAALTLLIIVIVLAVVKGISADFGELILPMVIFVVVETGLIKVGIDHIRYSGK